MKLSKRERVLISILLLALIVYFGYQYVPFEKIFKLGQLEEEYSLKKSIYDTMSQNIILKKTYESKLQELSDEINNTNMLSDLQQEKIIVFLNNYLASKNINANNISFTEATAAPINNVADATELRAKSSLESIMDEINEAQDNVANSGSDNNKSTETPSDSQVLQQDMLTVRSISANVAFESSYNDMISFIDVIQNNPIDISITNLNTVSGEAGLLQGTMTLSFYAVPKLDGYIEQNKDWIWNDLATSGKNNPFLLDGSQAFSNNNSGKFDFYVSLKPESSDLPTVLVGKTEDKNRTTYVYADSNTLENIEFQFKKEIDKYYYKYSTKNSKFPSDGSWHDFTPVGSSINVKIYSSQRNSKADSAGANINIVNTSGLKVRFEIEDDDKITPRVYFKDPKSVVVTRK